MIVNRRVIGKNFIRNYSVKERERRLTVTRNIEYTIVEVDFLPKLEDIEIEGNKIKIRRGE